MIVFTTNLVLFQVLELLYREGETSYLTFSVLESWAMAMSAPLVPQESSTCTIVELELQVVPYVSKVLPSAISDASGFEEVQASTVEVEQVALQVVHFNNLKEWLMVTFGQRAVELTEVSFKCNYN